MQLHFESQLNSVLSTPPYLQNFSTEKTVEIRKTAVLERSTPFYISLRSMSSSVLVAIAVFIQCAFTYIT